MTEAVGDYLRGCRYAFSRPWGSDRDVGLNRNVIASVASIVIALVGVAGIVADGAWWNLLWVAGLVLFGTAEGAVVVHRYRRRDEPDDKAFRVLERMGTRLGDRIADRRERRSPTE